VTDLSTRYMGLHLRNPVVASASPMTGDMDMLRSLEDHGAAAVVLPSMFEEQIVRDQQVMQQLLSAGAGVSEASGGYFPALEAGGGDVTHYLDLIAGARSALDIPVIASLNGASDSGWLDFARLLEQAGASAVELNLYDVPLDLGPKARDVEQRTIAIVRNVREAIGLPLAVKLNPYFSAFGQIAQALEAAGADALVLFNRLYHPDIDPVRLRTVPDLKLSRRHEMRLPMMWLAALRGRVTVSLAATTGVESADDVVRYLLAGADAVMSTSALLRNGPGYAASLIDGLAQWLDAREFSGVTDIRGLLVQPSGNEAGARERDAYRTELRQFRPSLFVDRD
jgi:dihydroorotate dehydrogenase (fumarate)